MEYGLNEYIPGKSVISCFVIRIIYTPQFSVALFIYMLYYSTKGVEI